MNIDTQAERDLFAGTTQGEWEVTGAYGHLFAQDNGDDKDVSTVLGEVWGRNGFRKIKGRAAANVRWIVNAHNAYPALLDEIDKGREAQRKLEEALDAIRTLVRFLDCNPKTLSKRAIDQLNDRLRRIAGEGGQDE